MTEAPFLVKVWGARGSLPGPAADNCAFGSESPCVEMRCGGHVLIFDAGSGIEGLSARLRTEGVKDFDVMFSHCHFDHIMGLPFLRTLYDADATVRIHAGHFEDGTTCRQMVDRFMAPPFFPITPKYFCADIDYRDFRPPAKLTPHEGIVISTVRLNHPNGAVGYRVDHAGRAACYITDTEHVPGKPDQNILSLIQGTDLVIYDSTYTEEEFPSKVGWGHSTWQEAVRLAKMAGVKKLALFHHDPEHDDTFMDKVAEEARAEWEGAVVAKEGMTFEF
jgi:phosphoribosyl 1,2-cyclic phosphodiesterase